MGLMDYLVEKVRGSKPEPKKRRNDINLPDESAGKPVGQLRFNEKSKEPLKQSYIDRVRKEMRVPDDIQQEEQSRIIFGGDPDDPRWDEHNKRIKGLFPAKGSNGK